MAKFGEVQMRFSIPNIKAARALVKAATLVQEIAEGQEWNADAQKAMRLLKRAMKGLRLEGKSDAK